MATFVRAYLQPANGAIDEISVLSSTTLGEDVRQFWGRHISDMENVGWRVIEDSDELEEIERNHAESVSLGYTYRNHIRKILILE